MNGKICKAIRIDVSTFSYNLYRCITLDSTCCYPFHHISLWTWWGIQLDHEYFAAPFRQSAAWSQQYQKQNISEWTLVACKWIFKSLRALYTMRKMNWLFKSFYNDGRSRETRQASETWQWSQLIQSAAHRQTQITHLKCWQRIWKNTLYLADVCSNYWIEGWARQPYFRGLSDCKKRIHKCMSAEVLLQQLPLTQAAFS